MKSQSRRFDPVPLTLIGFAVVVIGFSWLVSQLTHSAEAEWLARTYGPDRQSQYYEEWIVRDFFKDRRGGTFVDVGASNPKVRSNTWYLETALDWSGVAVDAQPEYAEAYRTARPGTVFRSFFVSDRSSDRVKLFFNNNPLVASATPAFTERWGELQGSKTVETITLDDLLEAEHVTSVDYLTMDIELAEPKALAGFDVRRFAPRLVCVEAHPEVRQQILDYFADRNYSVVSKYLRVDEDNLWFAPRGTDVQPFPPEVMAEWRTGHDAGGWWSGLWSVVAR